MTVLSRAIAAATDGARVCPRWLVLTLAGIAFVLVLGLPTVIIPFATDQVWFALGARTILDGDQLYRDFWDQKPPLIYLLYAVPFALVGEHMEAVRVFDLANVGLAMAGVFLLGRRFFSELAELAGAACVDTRPILSHLGVRASRADRFWSDLARPEQIEEPFLREFTQAAREASIPVLLGGHSLVSGGLMLLTEHAWRDEDRRAQGG